MRPYPIPEHARAERITGQFCEMIAEDEDLKYAGRFYYWTTGKRTRGRLAYRSWMLR